MNERIKELAKQVGIELVMTEFTGCLQDQNYLVTDRNLTAKQLDQFAQRIIADCIAAPRVYLLNDCITTDCGTQRELAGWTNDIKVAWQWRDHAPGRLRREFQDLHFIQKIDTP